MAIRNSHQRLGQFWQFFNATRCAVSNYPSFYLISCSYYDDIITIVFCQPSSQNGRKNDKKIDLGDLSHQRRPLSPSVSFGQYHSGSFSRRYSVFCLDYVASHDVFMDSLYCFYGNSFTLSTMEDWRDQCWNVQ